MIFLSHLLSCFLHLNGYHFLIDTFSYEKLFSVLFYNVEKFKWVLSIQEFVWLHCIWAHLKKNLLPFSWAHFFISNGRKDFESPLFNLAHLQVTIIISKINKFDKSILFSASCPVCFVDILLKQQIVSYIKMRGLDVPTVHGEEYEKTEYSMKQFRLYSSEELTRLEFVKLMGYKYSDRKSSCRERV